MKFPLPVGGRCLQTSMFACLCLSGISPAADLDIPRGTLSVDCELVRVGTRSQLNREIGYSAPITSVVDIVTPNFIKPEKDLKMKVRGARYRVPSALPALNGMKIGDCDLILPMELGQANTSRSGFVLQELVVLVTFP